MAAPIAAAALGEGSSRAASGWASHSFNEGDPVEVALATGLRESAALHVASSTAEAYRGPWNSFVDWCTRLKVPRCPLPADEMTVALYLQSVVERSNTFAPVKSASAAIAYFQKINLHHHLPTQSPTVGMVRQAATRKFGLTPKGRKEPFQWAQVVAFALEFGVRNRGYCHLVVASMAVVMFGGMCRYDDASHLRWRNVKFDSDGSCFHLSFEKRKNAQFRQGNRVTVAAATSGPVCPFKLLEMLYVHTGREEDAFVFRGFNGRLVKKSPERTSPGKECITYAQFSTFLALWFGGVLGISPTVFQSRFGS